MPSLNSVAQQENWDVVDDGETRDRMNGENDNIEFRKRPEGNIIYHQNIYDITILFLFDLFV